MELTLLYLKKIMLAPLHLGPALMFVVLALICVGMGIYEIITEKKVSGKQWYRWLAIIKSKKALVPKQHSTYRAIVQFSLKTVVMLPLAWALYGSLISENRRWLLIGVATFIYLLTYILYNWVLPGVYQRFHQKYKSAERIWTDTILFALYQPVRGVVLILGSLSSVVLLAAGFVLRQHLRVIPAGVSPYVVYKFLLSIIPMFLVVMSVWVLIRFANQLELHFSKVSYTGKGMDPDTVGRLCRLLKVVAFIIAGLSILFALKIPLAGMLTFGGISTLAITLAGKDLLANFFGGFMLKLDCPFSEGDWIRSPDKSIEGTVEHIGLRMTRIRTFDKRPLYVPNAVFLSIAVENPSRMSNRRIKTVIGLRYADASKIDTILSSIKQMLRKHPEIDTEQTLIVNLVEFGVSSLNFLVYTFTKTTDWVKFQIIQQDVFLRILTIIEQYDAQCAFPTTTLDMAEAALPFDEDDQPSEVD